MPRRHTGICSWPLTETTPVGSIGGRWARAAMTTSTKTCSPFYPWTTGVEPCSSTLSTTKLSLLDWAFSLVEGKCISWFKLLQFLLVFAPNFRIIGLYTTLVLVASKGMRGFFSGVCFTIMFDDLPDVDRILQVITINIFVSIIFKYEFFSQLCLDIYLVRESGELSLEEALAAKLIFLFRSPSTLIKWSRPREDEDGSEASSDDDMRSRQGSRQQQAIMQ